MAYNSANLSALAYANGFTLWHYKSTDSAGTVDTSGYFNDASEFMRAGDFILANVSTGGTSVHGIFIVLTNSGGVVDVSNITQWGTSNTD